MRSRSSSVRLVELDALRGLASMVVVLGHWLATAPAWGQDTFATPGYGALNALKYSPLRLISAAPEAVIVFFVLSGFVLALPGRPAYGSFLVRRAFRIYPAAWVALAGAALLATATGSSWVTGAPDIVNAASVGPLDVVGLVGHADLLHGSDSLRVDGVVLVARASCASRSSSRCSWPRPPSSARAAPARSRCS